LSTAVGGHAGTCDSFRQAALVSSKKSFEEFEADVANLRARLDKVRGMGLTAPNVCFKLGQRKISSGDYHFHLDAGEDQKPVLPPASEDAKPKNLLGDGGSSESDSRKSTSGSSAMKRVTSSVGLSL
jgi:hypothetical protein